MKPLSRHRWSSWPALLALPVALVLTSCGRDTTTAPPGRYSLSGHLRLTGAFIDTLGVPAGTRVVGDADGVPVDLLAGAEVIAHTTTVHGVYTFTGLAPGAYQARSMVIGNVWDKTNVFTIVRTDLAAGDTLRLVSEGDLYPVPNPVATETTIYFELPETTLVDIRIRDLAGGTVRKLLQAKRPPGLNQVIWTGVDSAGTPARSPLYWATFEAGQDVRVQLLFR
jgi:hypothetical protein